MTLVGTVHWTFLVLAVAATTATVLLLLWSMRGRSTRAAQPRSDRRRAVRASRIADPREALALVGDALAATHNPRVLLPVILEVITEATDALGGQIFSGAEEVAWIGEVGGSRKPLSLELDATTRLLLFPPDNGFSRDTRTLAEWLASQAGVALENARLHDIVQRQAITDDLTGLVNRRRFIEALDAEIERARRFDSPLAIVLADLDNFKQVNDEFGHHGGDLVLRAFADLIRLHVRDVDVSGRIGGEEFAILLPETDNAGAAHVAERMRRSLNDVSIPLRRRDDSRRVELRGCRAALGQSGDDLMRAADTALYAAKAAGKNCVADWHKPEIGLQSAGKGPWRYRLV